MIRTYIMMCAAALAGGCIKSKGPKKLAQATPVTVAYLVETPAGWSAAVPERFADAQSRALAERNLTPQRIDPARGAKLAGAALTDARLASLAAGASSPMVVLVEASTRYDSVLAGRYRWTVFAKVTVADRQNPRQSVTRSFSVPVILEYDHEEAGDALADAARSVSAELGKVIDSYVASYGAGGGGPPAPPPQSAAEHEAIYLILVDRFANGNRANDHGVDRGDPQAWHGGDLAGVTAKLDYIQSLGFTGVWLTPITGARRDKFHGHGAYHGYWTTELGGLNPMLGTAEELEALREGLEARRMDLIFDLVLNHVGPGAELASARPDWFHRRGKIDDWNDPIEVTDGDVHGLPDLDQDNAEVYRYLLDHSAQWLERARPAAFRMDAVRHIDGAFWRRFLPELRRRAPAGFQMIGEVFDGNPAAIAGAFELGFDRVFDFPLYFAAVQAFCDGAPLSSLAAALAADRAYARPAGLVTFADNHDLPRLASRCADPVARRQLVSFLLSVRGVPSITYGTEVGLSGAEEPANRADMRFGRLDATGRLIRDLLARRAAHPSLRGTRREFLEVSDDRLVWRQHGGGETARITVDRSATEVRFSAEPIEAPRPVAIRWRARGAPDGEPALVGNTPELGLWARPHTARTLSLPSGEVVAFKLAVVKPDGSLVIEGGDNRTLLVRDPTELELTWQK